MFRLNHRLIQAAVSLCLSSPLLAQQIYVDDDAVTGANDGSSWPDAFTDLQLALNQAQPSTVIWVAEGTYIPSVTTTTDPRSATFSLPDDIAIIGAFKPGDTSVATRTGLAEATILSGRLTINQSPGIYINERAYSVVTPDGNGATAAPALLRSFKIKGGGESAPGSGGGGGVDCIDSYLQLRDCIFTENDVGDDGGGLLAFRSKLEMRSCLFDDNSAYDTGGGASLFDTLGHAWIWNCHFKNNRTTTVTGLGSGGAMFISGPSPGQPIPGPVEIYNCLFHDNSAQYGGALLCNSVGVIEIGNSTIAYNSATDAANLSPGTGGGMWVCQTTTITNCVVYMNSMRSTTGRPGVDYSSLALQPTVRYSDCQPEVLTPLTVTDPPWTGINGNLTQTPTFVSAAARDLALVSTSVGVDDGENASIFPDRLDLDDNGNPNPNEPTPYDFVIGQDRVVPTEGTVDMGAFESQ
ncbi:MAG: hypothetical protein GY722_03900 [bacterium]|nr:hypothetical protein [bacterium]